MQKHFTPKTMIAIGAVMMLLGLVAFSLFGVEAGGVLLAALFMDELIGVGLIIFGGSKIFKK